MTTIKKLYSDLKFENKDLKEPGVYLINKDNATETTFMIGGFGITDEQP